MKLFSAICFVAALLLFSCEDAPYPIGEPVVRLQTDLSQRILASTGAPADTTRADSLLVGSVKMLVRQVRLHREQTADTGYELLVGPPLVLTLPAGEVYSAIVPPGNYDGVAAELTRLTESEAVQYASDGRYADFTVADRPSFIVEGTVLKHGVWSPFRLVGDTVVATTMLFDSPVGIPKGSFTELVLLLDLPQLMLFGRDIINPLGKGNDRILEGRFAHALKIMKKDR